MRLLCKNPDPLESGLEGFMNVSAKSTRAGSVKKLK
jgi:hypothetical protein